MLRIYQGCSGVEISLFNVFRKRSKGANSRYKIKYLKISGSPVAKTWTLTAMDLGSILSWGTKIPYASLCRGGKMKYSERNVFSSVQSLSHVQFCNPMNHSTPGLPVHHQLLESTQPMSIESVIPSKQISVILIFFPSLSSLVS